MNYLKKKVLNPEMYEEHRKETIKFREGAISTAFDELDGILNKTALARDYFGKSQSWFSQKLNGCNVCNNTASFTAQETLTLADAFRDLAVRLQGLAEEIEQVADIGIDD